MMPAPPTPFAPQYRDTWYALAPPWLSTDNAERYMFALQWTTDVLLDRARQAAELRMPGIGDFSNLAYLSYDRQMVQGPGEPQEAFALRLQQAIPAWNLAGSRRAVLGQVQAYLTNLQPGADPTGRLAVIVGGYYDGSAPDSNATWDWLSVGAEQGTLPAHLAIFPSNWNWDGLSQSWRDWLILPMASVLVASGSGASTGAASPSACLTSPGQNVAGVWVPATSGTPVNSPWLEIDGVSGASVGMWLTITGSSNPGNNGTFPIVSTNPVTIANPDGVPSDTGPLEWTLSSYPFLAPGPVYGAPGVVYGQGQTNTPPLDTGSNVGGVWQPTTSSQGFASSLAWGLASGNALTPNPAATIASLRAILRAWKSARTYYPSILVSFGASEFYPLSGAANPTGTMGSHGQNVAGVWVPTTAGSSTSDAFCQGTGRWVNCSVQNVT
jgi:hypothetical protein